MKKLPEMQETQVDPWVGKIPWRRKWQPTPVFLPGKPHGQRSVASYSPWGCRRVGQSFVTIEQTTSKVWPARGMKKACCVQGRCSNVAF